MEIASLLHPDLFCDPDAIMVKLGLYIGDKHLYTGVASRDAE